VVGWPTLPTATEQVITQALMDRQIVRTWPLRGTLHVVAARDVRWLLALLAPRIITQSAGRYRQLELDQPTITASQQLLSSVLQGGQQRTRDDLMQLLDQSGIRTTGQRGYHLLMRAALDGLICFGAQQGKQHTFTLLEEWIPPTPPRTRPEALAELAHRYIASHSPATLNDLARWAGLTLTDAKTGLAANTSSLFQQTIGDTTYWHAPATAASQAHADSVYLLPGFDEFLLGYANRDAVLEPQYANAICPGGNGVFNPTIIVDGHVVGTWRRTIKKAHVLMSMAFFQPFDQNRWPALQHAAHRYAAFLGLQAQLEIE
jgi:Winged helix DNA-binding domain